MGDDLALFALTLLVRLHERLSSEVCGIGAIVEVNGIVLVDVAEKSVGRLSLFLDLLVIAFRNRLGFAASLGPLSQRFLDSVRHLGAG